MRDRLNYFLRLAAVCSAAYAIWIAFHRDVSPVKLDCAIGILLLAAVVMYIASEPNGTDNS